MQATHLYNLVSIHTRQSRISQRVLISIVKIFWIFYPILAFISLGMGLILSTLNSIISKIVFLYEIGEIFGVTESLMSLVTVLGPL